MILIEQRAPVDQLPTERLVLPFDLRCKSRLRTRLESGEEAGLFLERGAVLRAGDRLLANDGRVVEVAASHEAVMEVRSTDALLLARAAYHLGNRHVAVELKPDHLKLEPDHVLAEMLQRLNLIVSEEIAPFEPEGGAYAAHGGPHEHGRDHSHEHGHGHAHGHGHDH
jgi:urease accessory protein